MQSITLSFTVDEIKAVLHTVHNQLFHIKYLDPRFPGYKAQPGQVEAVESAIRTLEAALKEHRLHSPAQWETPTRYRPGKRE